MEGFLAQSLPTIKSLPYNTKTRFAVSLAEYSYENIPLTEMLSSLKVAKKQVHVYCFHGKHFTYWDLLSMLKTDNFTWKDGKQTIYPDTFLCVFINFIHFFLYLYLKSQ